MYKAIFTKDGAKRMGVPKLAGQEFDYDRLIPPEEPLYVDNIYCNGHRIGSFLSFGDDPDDPAGCVLITRPQ